MHDRAGGAGSGGGAPAKSSPAAAAGLGIGSSGSGVSSADPNFQYQISWVLTLQETAGVAATLTEVDAVIDDAIIKFGPGALDAQSTSGSNQVAAKGTLQLNQTIAYTFGNGSRLATVVITGYLTDANGNRIIKSTQIRIV